MREYGSRRGARGKRMEIVMRAAGKMAAAVMVIAMATPQSAEAWGNEGHIWINEAAALRLPKDAPQFLRDAVAQLGYLGPEPDRWRNTAGEPQLKYSQEPDHFINMERVPAWRNDEWPRDRFKYIRKLDEQRAEKIAQGADERTAKEFLPEDIGFQPYIVMEVFERLKVAFREYRHAVAEHRSTLQPEHDAVFYAGWLGHYVADGSQPLHVSIHYNGWVGDDPNGYARHRKSPDIHWDFESRFVKESQSEQDFSKLVEAPRVLEHPFADYIAYLKESQSLVEQFYKLEKAGAFEGKGTAEGREFTRKRLAAGAQMLANLWYTAWQESAVDPPDPYAEPKGK